MARIKVIIQSPWKANPMRNSQISVFNAFCATVSVVLSLSLHDWDCSRSKQLSCTLPLAGRICFQSESQKSFKINERIEAKSMNVKRSLCEALGGKAPWTYRRLFRLSHILGLVQRQEMIDDPGDSIVELWDSNFASGTHHHRHHSLWKRRTEWWFSHKEDTFIMGHNWESHESAWIFSIECR